jgi:hypothetical protein
MSNTPNLPEATAQPGLPETRSECPQKPAVGQNHLTQSLSYDEVLEI